jgi:hypothetical protein
MILIFLISSLRLLDVLPAGSDTEQLNRSTAQLRFAACAATSSCILCSRATAIFRENRVTEDVLRSEVPVSDRATNDTSRNRQPAIGIF